LGGFKENTEKKIAFPGSFSFQNRVQATGFVVWDLVDQSKDSVGQT
jgi:hypothetical protein